MTSKSNTYTKELKVDKYLKCEPEDVKQEIRKCVQEVEQCLSERKINENRKPFPKPIICATFANSVYKNLHQEKVDPPDGWIQVVTGRNDDNNYYGAVFINSKDQQVVIAHRGTTMTIGSLKADIKSIVNNNISTHMLSAITFTAKVIEALPRPGCGGYFQVSITGHSLGGWLAQVTTYTTKYLKRDETEDIFVKDENFENKYHIRSVTFDNPGSFEMMDKLKDDTSPRFEDSSYGDTSVLDMNSYLSAPNRINSCNKHVGKIFRTFPSFKEGSIPIKDNYNIISHRMNNFLEYFKNREAKKKAPKCANDSKMVREVLDWPLKKPKFSFWSFFSFSKSSEYDQLFTELKAENDFHVDEPDSPIRYRAEKKANEKKYSVRVLTEKEQNFISNLLCLKSDDQSKTELCPDFVTLNDFLAKHPDAKRVIIKLLLEYQIQMDDGYITCSETKNLPQVVSLVKQVLFHLPPIYDRVEQQVKEIPSANQKFWRALSKQYVNTLGKFKDLKFLDVLEITSFLSNTTEKYFWIETDYEDNEMERLYNIIENKDSTLFLHSKLMKNSERVANETSLYENKLLVILHVKDDSKKSNMKITDLIKNIKNKVIIVSKASSENIFEDVDVEGRREKSNNITVGELEPESKMVIMKKKILFQGKILTTLQEMVEEMPDDKRDSVNEFIDRQYLEEFLSETPIIKIGQDQSVCTSLAIRFSKMCKDITDMDVVFKCINNSQAKERFLITGISKEEFVTKYGHHVQDIPKKLILNDDCAVDGPSVFHKKCKEDMDSNESAYKHETIYWLHYHVKENDSTRPLFTWEQVYNVDFYMKRKLIKRNKFNKNFLKVTDMQKRETFIIQGTEEIFKKYIKNLPNYDENKTYKQIIDKQNVLYVTEANSTQYLRPSVEHKALISCSSLDEFEKPYHTIKLQTNGESIDCFWIKTDGPIKSIDSIVDYDRENLLDETNLGALLCERIVIVADEPGMGKSTLLTAVAEQLIAKGQWVVRFDLNSFKASMEQYTHTGLEGLLDYLKGCVGDEFKKKLTINLLRMDMEQALFRQVYIFMDGFDEIREKHMQTNIVRIIQYLRQSTKINCWISTRTYTKDILETGLSIFGLSIQEIGDREQKEYLKRIWNIGVSFNENKKNADFFTKQAETTLDQAKKFFGKEAKMFIGNPLHLRLMADALMPDIVKYSNLDDTPVYLDSIFKLYKKFLSNKYEIYFREKSDIRAELRYLLQSHINYKFQEIAFKSRFPEEGEAFFGKKDISEQLAEELHRVGLVRTKNSTVKVFHETFVDYYCATLIMDWLDSHAKSPPIEEFLLTKIFMKEDYKYIRHFMNEQPIENVKKIPIEDIWNAKQNIFYNEQHETLVHVLAQENQINILGYIFSCCKASHLGSLIKTFLSVRSLDGKTALYVAAENENDDMVRYILSEMNSFCFRDAIEEIVLATMFRCPDDKTNEVIGKLLNLIEASSDYGLVKEVLKELKDINYLENIENFVKLLRDKSCTVQEVRSILQSMKTETQRKYLLHSRNSSWKTAIHIIAYEGNLQIIKYLLATGAELVVYDKNKRTPLQNAVESKNLEVVQYLVEQGHSVDAKDETEMDALLKSAKLGCLDILKYLADKGADVFSQDKCNINALLHAAKGGHLETVKYLIEVKKLCVQHKDCYNITALSWAAENKNNLKVVKYLLEEAGAELDCRDRNGMTPLHHAAKKQNQAIVEYLLDKGADMNIPDRNKTSIFQRILRWTGPKKWDFVRMLITKYPINFNQHDDVKYTPLQKVLQDNKFDIAKIMLEEAKEEKFKANMDYLTEDEINKYENWRAEQTE